MNPLKQFSQVNNMWVDLKHQVSHWKKRHKRNRGAVELSINNPQNVLLVIIDCLRADHVSGFGYERDTTPSLDRFDAAAFVNAKAPSTWTFPSVPSLLSGRYPHEHGARFETDPRDLSTSQFPKRPRHEVPMLPDLLDNAGYATRMISAIPMAEKAVGDRFHNVSVRYNDARERVEAAREWIKRKDRWFIYLHLGDPHVPLDITEEHRETFDVPNMEGVKNWRYREANQGNDFEAYRDIRIRAYDAAIRNASDALEELLFSLSEDTVVVISGDHGEAFWEHPQLERRLNNDPRGYYATDHGHSVLEELTRVPLWIRAPEIDRGKSDRPVSLVDVLPTILNALEAEIPDSISGRDLSKSGLDRPLLCEETAYGYNQRAVWLGGKKIVSVPETETKLAFDIDHYFEGEPLPEVPESLERALDTFDEGIESGKTIDIDDETRNRLKELGYLE